MIFAQEPSSASEWFVSYAWGDETAEGKARQVIVDKLCTEAATRGIRILRDKDDIGLGERISKFMERLGQGDRVFIVLSDKYLKSPFCMFELCEVWRNCRQDDEDFLKRIRVYTLPCAKISSLAYRLDCAGHWSDEYSKVKARVEKHGYDILGEKGWADYRRMKQFSGSVNDILTTVADTLQPRSFDELEKYGFSD